MGPLAPLLVGVLLLAVLGQRAAPTGAVASGPPVGGGSPEGKRPGGLADEALAAFPALASAAGAAAPVVAAGLAYGLGGAFVGEKLAGDPAGRLAGLNPNVGVPIAAGVGAGRVVDQIFGGTGGGTSGTTAQVAGGFVGTMGAIFGIGAAIAALPVSALAYGIASAVSDLNELAKGQAGAERDYEAGRGALIQPSSAIGQAMFQLAENWRLYPPASMYVWLAVQQDPTKARHVADYRNRELFREWMKKGARGIGVSDAYHLRHGLDRGKFVGQAISGRPGWLWFRGAAFHADAPQDPKPLAAGQKPLTRDEDIALQAITYGVSTATYAASIQAAAGSKTGQTVLGWLIS